MSTPSRVQCAESSRRQILPRDTHKTGETTRESSPTHGCDCHHTCTREDMTTKISSAMPSAIAHRPFMGLFMPSRSSLCGSSQLAPNDMWCCTCIPRTAHASPNPLYSSKSSARLQRPHMRFAAHAEAAGTASPGRPHAQTRGRQRQAVALIPFRRQRVDRITAATTNQATFARRPHAQQLGRRPR